MNPLEFAPNPDLSTPADDTLMTPKIKSPGIRMMWLLFIALAGLILCTAIMMLLPSTNSGLLVGLILQDALVFIAPAILAMMLAFHKPLHTMHLLRAPSWWGITLVVAVAAASLPALNWVVEWNKQMHLPQSLAAVEQWMRASEDLATEVTDRLLNTDSIGMLIVTTLVVGILAGISEEIFFRGAMVPMLSSRLQRPVITIWAVATIFSAIHMQFFGFVPRLLLGAWFGYLLLWTRSLWVPVIAHALNNSIVVIATHLGNRGVIDADAVEQLGVAQNGQFPWIALLSAVATALLIAFFYPRFVHDAKKNSHNAPANP